MVLVERRWSKFWSTLYCWEVPLFKTVNEYIVACYLEAEDSTIKEVWGGLVCYFLAVTQSRLLSVLSVKVSIIDRPVSSHNYLPFFNGLSFNQVDFKTLLSVVLAISCCFAKGLCPFWNPKPIRQKLDWLTNIADYCTSFVWVFISLYLTAVVEIQALQTGKMVETCNNDPLAGNQNHWHCD